MLGLFSTTPEPVVLFNNAKFIGTAEVTTFFNNFYSCWASPPTFSSPNDPAYAGDHATFSFSVTAPPGELDISIGAFTMQITSCEIEVLTVSLDSNNFANCPALGLN